MFWLKLSLIHKETLKELLNFYLQRDVKNISLTFKFQQNLIKKIIENSTNLKVIQFFSNVSDFFDFFSNLNLTQEEPYFEFQMYNCKNEEEYSIHLLYNATEILFNQNLLNSDELKNLILKFERYYFEIKYFDKLHDKIYSSVLNLKYSLDNDKLINVGAFITGSKEIIRKNDGNSFIKYVKIDSSVTKISNECFKKWTELERISIPSSVTIIGDSAFCKCSSLVQVSIPSSITKISKYLFNECSSLERVLIPTSVKVIEESAFKKCISLKDIVLPLSITSIGESTFNECKSLPQISIPTSLTKIDSYVFFRCSSLKKVSIPSSVTSIGESAFEQCYSLQNPLSCNHEIAVEL